MQRAAARPRIKLDSYVEEWSARRRLNLRSMAALQKATEALEAAFKQAQASERSANAFSRRIWDVQKRVDAAVASGLQVDGSEVEAIIANFLRDAEKPAELFEDDSMEILANLKSAQADLKGPLYGLTHSNLAELLREAIRDKYIGDRES